MLTVKDVTTPMKLFQDNDWGSLTYFLSVRRPEPHPEYRTYLKPEKGDHLIPKQGGQYLVQWENGKREVVQIEMRPYDYPVSDMGNRYTVPTARPWFKIVYHGTELWILAEEVDALFSPVAETGSML